MHMFFCFLRFKTCPEWINRIPNLVTFLIHHPVLLLSPTKIAHSARVAIFCYLVLFSSMRQKAMAYPARVATVMYDRYM